MQELWKLYYFFKNIMQPVRNLLHISIKYEDE